MWGDSEHGHPHAGPTTFGDDRPEIPHLQLWGEGALELAGQGRIPEYVRGLHPSPELPEPPEAHVERRGAPGHCLLRKVSLDAKPEWRLTEETAARGAEASGAGRAKKIKAPRERGREQSQGKTKSKKTRRKKKRGEASQEGTTREGPGILSLSEKSSRSYKQRSEKATGESEAGTAEAAVYSKEPSRAGELPAAKPSWRPAHGAWLVLNFR